MSSNAIVQYTISSSHAINRYDVFVSFRGEDTRNNFTGFLFQALRRKGIHAFKDDQDLRKGESIAPELLHAIQSSRLFIVVFSNNYASSTWCLRELAEIRNCVQTSPRPIIPVFYDVDPSVVRKQSECYEKAFADHEKRFREDKVKMEEAERWRKALTDVANLSGWDIRNKLQYVQIEEIVQNVINTLGPKIFSLPKDEVVGIEYRLEELVGIEHRLESVNNVRVVGISGMGGIGKTTLARALYERIYHQYDFHCFIDDVSKIYRDSSSLGVQKQLISQSLNDKNLEISNSSEGTCLIWSRLHNVRALVVLDNVDEVEQLRMFTGKRDTLLRECLGEGSIIIVVSRDEHILRTHGVDDIYQVQPLNYKNAMQLFCRNAFKVNHILSDYEKLAWDVLSYAQGHPLAIEVIGSSLFGRNVSQWESALARLKEKTSKNIMDVLRISFDQLDEDHKEIFLDIACALCDCDEEYVTEVLNFRGFNPEFGLQVLLDKSLISKRSGNIDMHPLLKDLGMYIVKEESPKEPLKRSRLCDYQDLCKAMSNNQVLPNLKRLDLSYSQNLVEIPDVAEALNLEWIVLERCIKLRKLSPSIGLLRKLTTLNLNDCKNLVSLPNSILGLISLEYLGVYGCSKLFKNELLDEARNTKHLKKRCLVEGPIHSHSKSHLIKKMLLWPLGLLHSRIQRESVSCLLPSSPTLPCLRELDLRFCNLVKIPDAIGKLSCLEKLNLKGNNFVRLPNLKDLSRLYYLNLQHCKRLKYLPDLPSQTHLPLNLYLYPIEYFEDLTYQLPNEDEFIMAGLMMFNCPEIVERERCTSMTISWMLQIGQVCMFLPYTFLLLISFGIEKQLLTHNITQSWCRRTSIPFFKSLESIIPGSEIPMWFNNQFVSMDNSIIIDASPFVHDNNWVGIVCCAIFGEGISGKLNLATTYFYKTRILEDLGISLDHSDHMWLFYFPRYKFPPNFRLTFIKRDVIRLCKESMDSFERFANYEVKKYGYRLVN